MKKIAAFLILMQSTLFFSQTVLATHPLELRKAKTYKQIITAENTNTHELFVFATDKDTLSILKYNNALFLSNQYALARPDIDYIVLAGYSFNDQGNPTLYWSSVDSKKMLAVLYDLGSKTSTTLEYEIPLLKESIISKFQENNTFYILTQKENEQKLVLYVFKNDKKEEKILDFTSFKFQNKNTEVLTLNQVLEVCPIEPIAPNEFNPLFKGTQKTKMYVLKNRLLLTLDHNYKETQTFDVDLTTFKIEEKKFLQPITKKQTGSSNSYYHESKLYQLTINEDELLFDIKDYQTSGNVKSFVVAKTDTIPFKNSPLWIQTNGQKPRELKNTNKFLQRLLFLDVGLTVYKTPKAIMITLGGTNDGINNQNDLSLGLNAAFSGNFVEVAFDLLNNSGPTTVYFESAFDKKLQNNKPEQDPIAVDFISLFVQEHDEVTLANTFRYKNYYILGYYDNYAKQYTMRKFTDGYERLF